MIEDIYVSGAFEADPCKQRFLVMMVLLFFGIKRYSDIAKLTINDVCFLGAVMLCLHNGVGVGGSWIVDMCWSRAATRVYCRPIDGNIRFI